MMETTSPDQDMGITSPRMMTASVQASVKPARGWQSPRGKKPLPYERAAPVASVNRTPYR